MFVYVYVRIGALHIPYLPGLGDSNSGPHTCEAGESFCSVNNFPELFCPRRRHL